MSSGERFLALAQAFAVEAAAEPLRPWLRFAALVGISSSLGHEAFAARAGALAAALRTEAALPAFYSPLALPIAAMLVRNHIDPRSFVAEALGASARMAAAGLPGEGVPELASIAVLRLLSARADDADAINHVRQLFREMARRHWWLAGPEDVPLCALLAHHRDAPAAEARVERHYHRLRDRGFAGGAPSLASATVLAASTIGEDRALERFLALARAFDATPGAPWPVHTPALALLAMLDHRPEDIAAHAAQQRHLIAGPAGDDELGAVILAGVTWLDLAPLTRGRATRALTRDQLQRAGQHARFDAACFALACFAAATTQAADATTTTG